MESIMALVLALTSEAPDLESLRKLLYCRSIHVLVDHEVQPLIHRVRADEDAAGHGGRATTFFVLFPKSAYWNFIVSDLDSFSVLV